jgi:cytochrome c oxidase subunit 3
VLIVSSFTVAWALYSLRRDRPRTTLRMLALTLLLGVTFLVIKSFEYAHHIEDGILPGRDHAFSARHGLPEGAQLFFTLYYFMTGLHALHMIGGLVVMAWLWLRVRRGRTTAAYHAELELGALYWHLVDSIWIVLWPLFYLTG